MSKGLNETVRTETVDRSRMKKLMEKLDVFTEVVNAANASVTPRVSVFGESKPKQRKQDDE